MTTDELCGLPARALAEKLRRGEVSAVEALEAHLARIESDNHAFNAVVSLGVVRARRSAEAADAALKRGESLGALHGVPMTLKDGHDVADLRTTLGAPALDRIASDDGTVAWEKYFTEVDALLVPAAMTKAFTHRETGAPIDVDGEPASYWSLVLPMIFCNLTGRPSLAAPAGLDEDSLPIGVQIVGPRWSEMRLLEIAKALEQEEI